MTRVLPGGTASGRLAADPREPTMPHPALHGASHWCALSPLLFVAALLIPLAPASSAQQALYDVPAKFPGDQVGHALALSPDVDGDGYPDLLVSVRGRRIEWRSGRGGAPLNHFVPPVALATLMARSISELHTPAASP